MTRAERPDGSSARPPKPSWGPGKNAALSFVAFAAIFSLFAYTERDKTAGHASVTHDIAGAIDAAVGQYRQSIVAATTRERGASGPPAAAAPASTIARQAAPLARPGPTPAPSASTPREVSTVPPVTLAVEPPAASRVRPGTAARHRQPYPPPPAALAADTHGAPAHGRAAARSLAEHRAPRAERLAGTRKRLDFTPKAPPYGTDAARMQTASVTHEALEGARALAKARSCAVIDEWNCVAQNASRALAIDPTNSESRALLGQAIRNRL